MSNKKNEEAVVASKYEEKYEALLNSISNDYDELIDKLECIACIKAEIERERGSITVLEWAIQNAEYYLRRGEYHSGLIHLIADMKDWMHDSNEDIDTFHEEIKELKEEI